MNAIPDVGPYIRTEPGPDALGPSGHPLLPGGAGRSTFAVGGPAPTAVAGAGWRLRDDQGREVIDLNNNFAALVHGHAHPAVVAAAERAVRSGASFGLPNHSELRHARALVDRLPGVDQVRYTNSGTEAVMTALRIARAHTGRDACAFVHRAYHGTSDSALATGGAASVRGVPAGVLEDIVTLPINDAETLAETLAASPERFAALVLDFLPNRAGMIALTPEYVAAAVALCREHGILLIADEVISLRLRLRGLAADFDILPDLVVLGKLIGGGHPVGAVAGRAAVMGELDPTTDRGLEHGGTFSANPVTMEAGLATLELFDGPAIDRLNALGDAARVALAEKVAAHGWEVRGTGSLIRLHPGELPDHRTLARALWWEAYDRGVLLVPNGLATLSTPMDEAVVEVAVERVAAAVVAATRTCARAPAGS